MEAELLRALDTGGSALLALADSEPIDRRDRFACLHHVYGALTGPVLGATSRARMAAHPVLSEVKWRLEEPWLRELELLGPATDNDDAVAAIRTLAAQNRLPEVYRWLATEATLSQLVDFLAIEGGPDGAFDDLVAFCQVALPDSAKMELAHNYWDELGNGVQDKTHTALYRRMLDALPIRTDITVGDMTELQLERAAFPGLLSTNHWLQPEMLGALGAVELQAGPRCRLVAKAMARHGVSADVREFYEVHAGVDPRHGQLWLANAIAPMQAAGGPEWTRRMVRGAHWRIAVNDAFLDELGHLLIRKPALLAV